MSRADELLKDLTYTTPTDEYGNEHVCAYCKAYAKWDETLDDPETHKPNCPWRLAKEYLQEREI